MPDELLHICLNLDLDAVMFESVVAFATKDLAPEARVLRLDQLDQLDSASRAAPIEILACFSRRTSLSTDAMHEALAMIGRTDQTLEQAQLKQNVTNITLIDCGEILGGPLSDFNLLAQYLEAFSEAIMANVQGKILAADYDLDADDLAIVMYDTRSPEFVEHVMEHTRNSLSNLNTGMGQGDLPVFSD